MTWTECQCERMRPSKMVIQQIYSNNKSQKKFRFADTGLFSTNKKSPRMTICRWHYSFHSDHVCRLCPVIGQISSLQATQMTQEAAIRDLDNERSRLKDKVLRMEEERESLQSQSQALDERQRQQLQSLEKVRVCDLYSLQTGITRLWITNKPSRCCDWSVC